MIRAISFLSLCCAAAFGQTASNANSVIVTASRSTNIQPDQVVFSVTVSTPATATLNDAVNALQGTGITAANFIALNAVQVYDPTSGQQIGPTVVSWSFSLVVPLTALQSTVGLLTAVQKNIGAQNNGVSISFSVTGTQVSPQAQQAQACSQSDLLSAARAQAQALAAAAGKTLGSVLAMSGATAALSQSSGPVTTTVTTPACAITVKFQMVGL
jgi:uncharacterized protein YggE